MFGPQSISSLIASLSIEATKVTYSIILTHPAPIFARKLEFFPQELTNLSAGEVSQCDRCARLELLMINEIYGFMSLFF